MIASVQYKHYFEYAKQVFWHGLCVFIVTFCFAAMVIASLTATSRVLEAQARADKAEQDRIEVLKVLHGETTMRDEINGTHWFAKVTWQPATAQKELLNAP